MIEEGATLAQSGHFYVQNKPQNDSKGTCNIIKYWFFQQEFVTKLVTKFVLLDPVKCPPLKLVYYFTYM